MGVLRMLKRKGLKTAVVAGLVFALFMNNDVNIACAMSVRTVQAQEVLSVSSLLGLSSLSELLPEGYELSISPTPEVTPIVEITPELNPEVTSVPEITPEPSLEVTPMPEIIPESSPEVTPLPEITPTPSATPIPTPTPYIPKTLVIMSGIDYVKDSTTGLSSKQVSIQKLNKQLKNYGKLLDEGMPYAVYKQAMNNVWVDCTDYKTKPSKISFDITKAMDYVAYVNVLKKLSRYDGVYLYKIGESTGGKAIYSIEIDVESPKQKKVIMMTGQIHARESAGGYFLIKSLVDLVQKAQTDSKVMDLLKEYKYVAVPVINVDAKDNLIYNASKWKCSDGTLWKAYINGVDGNRNFPGLAWGELSNGVKLKWDVKAKPDDNNYAGDYAGSNSETQAMMKWVYHYAVIEKAEVLVDYHQQGRVVYAGKPWSTKKLEKNSQNLRMHILNLLNKNTQSYKPIEDGEFYGLNGVGSTITDYAAAVAFGAKFSPAYGFCTMVNGDKEVTLLEFGDMDNIKFKWDVPNPNFKTITLEIGYGVKYLGDTKSSRQLLATEYTKYHFDTLLFELPRMLK